MSHGIRQHRFPRTAALILASGLLCLSGSGCQMGRSWFQMDSNSGTPFFGLDLTPRYRTSQLTLPDSDGRASADEKRVPIRTASHKPLTAPGWKRLQLPTLTELVGGEEETNVSLHGPESPFSK